MTEVATLTGIILWVISAVVGSNIAGEKGYNPLSWALAVIFFGPIGFLATLGLPDLKQRKYLRLLCEHYGVSVSSNTAPQEGDLGDADSQRQRILGKK